MYIFNSIKQDAASAVTLRTHMLCCICKTFMYLQVFQHFGVDRLLVPKLLYYESENPFPALLFLIYKKKIFFSLMVMLHLTTMLQPLFLLRISHFTNSKFGLCHCFVVISRITRESTTTVVVESSLVSSSDKYSGM